jgi:cytochrome oxidase assembly protein ShyY1
MNRRRVIVAVFAGIVGVALTVALGNWQSRRAQYKLALQAQWDAAQRAAPRVVTAATLREVAAGTPVRVRLTGRFDHRHSVWLDNRQSHGRPGFYVITPFAIEGGTVLVARGWVARDPQDRLRLPAAGEPAGTLTIEGLALHDLPRLLELGPPADSERWPRVWQNLDFAAYERASGLTVARFVVQQTSRTADDLLRDWPPPDLGIDVHRGYALQWYSLAALIAGLTLYFGWRGLRTAQ